MFFIVSFEIRRAATKGDAKWRPGDNHYLFTIGRFLFFVQLFVAWPRRASDAKFPQLAGYQREKKNQSSHAVP